MLLFGFFIYTFVILINVIKTVMKKNALLNIAIIICKFFRLIYIVIFLMLTGLFVHSQINPSSYMNLDLNNKINEYDFSMNSYTTDKIIVNGVTPEDSEVFTFDKLKYSSLFFNFIKVTLVLFCSFLCLKEFQNIIESVKEIKTFQIRNVSSFRRIGKYLLVIFILMSYSSFTFQQGAISSFHISFTLLILPLLAYIMAEIFKEGKKLSDENKLTI
jgi:hypothetical protein